jgi:hypothetical protein
MLTGPIYHHAISMFNTCSWGPTHRSLTNTGGGYNVGGTDFPHHTSRPSQPAVSAFHLRVSPGLQFNNIPPSKPKFRFKEPMAATWSSDHPTMYRDPHLRLAISNNLFLAIGLTGGGGDRKVLLTQLGHPVNFYILMHQQDSY